MTTAAPGQVAEALSYVGGEWCTSGRSSSFGAVHAQGRDAIGFGTKKKVIIERWTYFNTGEQGPYEQYSPTI